MSYLTGASLCRYAWIDRFMISPANYFPRVQYEPITLVNDDLPIGPNVVITHKHFVSTIALRNLVCKLATILSGPENMRAFFRRRFKMNFLTEIPLIQISMQFCSLCQVDNICPHNGQAPNRHNALI